MIKGFPGTIGFCGCGEVGEEVMNVVIIEKGENTNIETIINSNLSSCVKKSNLNKKL